jgi:N6-L-threonylcarbamoyladenine synthase
MGKVKQYDEDVIILGVESSCDDTAAAVIRNGKLLANIVSNQRVHEAYGGVVPELASRAHQQNIVPVVHQALVKANIDKRQLSAVAFTRGPGLMGSLLVGSSFSKAFALAMDVPLIEVNHMQGHVLAHFIDKEPGEAPRFPFLCLTVSGGHTQIVLVKGHFDMQVLGETTDDAAGEAFDKIAKIMGLPYPGGPLVDKFAKEGDPLAFRFPHPHAPGLNFSFSGLKTAVLYFLNEQLRKDQGFIEKRKADLCASVQATIINILLDKLKAAAKETGIKEIAIAGGVSANSGLRSSLGKLSAEQGWNLYIPPFEFCTDNAAMIAIAGFYKYQERDFAPQDITPAARYSIENPTELES